MRNNKKPGGTKDTVSRAVLCTSPVCVCIKGIWPLGVYIVRIPRFVVVVRCCAVNVCCTITSRAHSCIHGRQHCQQKEEGNLRKTNFVDQSSGTNKNRQQGAGMAVKALVAPNGKYGQPPKSIEPSPNRFAHEYLPKPLVVLTA